MPHNQTVFIMPPRKKATRTNTKNSNDKDETKENNKKGKKKFVEPKITWANSDARRLLYEAIMSKDVPLEWDGLDKFGHTRNLKSIFVSIPELGLYDYKMLSSRLSSLRGIITTHNRRAAADEKAYEKFKQLHPPSRFAKKGYIQCQGSEAKKQLKKDMEQGLLEEYEKQDLWELRTVYYTNFPLKEFRDKIKQTTRTHKYMHTLKVKGKQHKAS